MSLLGRRTAAKRTSPASERWAQAVRDGQVRLDAFTQTELDCVTLDPEFLPIAARAPALQAVGPLLPLLAAKRAGHEPPPGAPARPALAQAASDLERRGYLRPGAPARSDAPVPFELAGWSADPAGGAELRPVTILGDLGIVTRARAQPSWVIEVAQPFDNTRPDPGTESCTVVTAAADRRHWILDGDHAERAVRVSANQLGERIQNLIQPIGTDI